MSAKQGVTNRKKEWGNYSYRIAKKMGLRYSIYIENPLSSPSSSYKSISDPLFHSQHRSQRNTCFITYGCRHCKTHLSSSFQIISRDYRGRTGTAYLMNKVVNVVEGKVEQRRMLTGDYLVCDILCHWCKRNVGWKYLQSSNDDQQYKEGKFILELKNICKCTWRVTSFAS